MRRHAEWNLLLGLALLLFVAACGGQETDQVDKTAAGAAGTYAAEPPGAAGEANEDVAHARKLWQEIKDYATWNEPDGFAGWQEGKSPHGAILRYHVNDVAQRDLEADGAVIVKANYAERSDEALESLTVMQKRTGYDPQTGDWFYAKLSPQGTVMADPQGMMLAGLVGKNKSEGCIACHAKAEGDDYLFMND